MLVDGVQVTPDNVQDWSAKRLSELKAVLETNIENNAGNCNKELLLTRIIEIEIDRQNRVNNINLSADAKKEWLVKRFTNKYGITID
ncbi:hypothetical protein [Lactobacillus gallinarum]|uniref:Uncharacterized protein n=1 Tax=Lactobacillus gallinarum TaxID=52242 RepID=A0A1Y4UKA6_9LACO|nr:hypothetical protein [Lactobacillus gallinarum]OUQ58259.1 hypothetical protein B5E59_00640 [Lactobacillus gallinarum]OUQ75511.1 hypothetical protein B5E44_07045 [Lactobacillus gallinarum]